MVELFIHFLIHIKVLRATSPYPHSCVCSDCEVHWVTQWLSCGGNACICANCVLSFHGRIVTFQRPHPVTASFPWNGSKSQMPAVTYESLWQSDPMKHLANRKCSCKTVTWWGNNASHYEPVIRLHTLGEQHQTGRRQSAAVMFGLVQLCGRGFLKKDGCDKNITFHFVKANCAFIKPSWSSSYVRRFGYFSVKNRNSKSSVVPQTKPTVLHVSHTLQWDSVSSRRRLLLHRADDPVAACSSVCSSLCCGSVCVHVRWMTPPTGAGSESK